MKGRKIPVLGIPVLNRGDLLERLIKSLDYPIEKLLIINNGNDGGVAAAIHKITNGLNPFVETVEIHKPGRNLGVAPSWNLIMAKYPDAPYWLIGSNDMCFSRKGDLEKVAGFIEANCESYAVMHAYAYNFFCVTKAGRDTIGTFDENIYPAYLEDCDHSYRAKLCGAIRINIPDIEMTHGDGPFTGSMTITSSRKFAAANHVTHGNNHVYYYAKWGGPNEHEVYQHPFNNPALPVSYWALDAERRIKQEEAWK